MGYNDVHASGKAGGKLLKILFRLRRGLCIVCIMNGNLFLVTLKYDFRETERCRERQTEI